MTLPFDMLRFVGATNVDLPIIGADPSGPFVLKGVDGLGPPERDVKISKTIREGGIRQGTRTANRQIVALVGLQPDWNSGQTSADLRNILYGLLTIPGGYPLQAHIMGNGSQLCVTQGDISKMEAAIFSKDPEVQITMDCDYPYLVNQTPFLQTPTKSLYSGQTLVNVLNDGDAPTGFKMEFTLSDPQSGDLIITQFGSLSDSKIRVGGTWNSGDKFTVDTRDGQRGVWRTPSGGSIASRLGKLTGGSEWLQMAKGDNQFLVNNTAINFGANSFQHTPSYWGV